MKRLVITCLTLMTCGWVTNVRAQEESSAALLKIGDPAPALNGGKWVKNEPVAKIEPGKMYVVEFWATWCGPCREAIPHMTEMSKQYKDVTFIGQDVWEQDQAKVEPFVQEMGDKMDYHIRMDDVPGNDGQQGKMAVGWMQAAGQNGIPTAFLIGKDSKIAWIGHPMMLEPVLKQVQAGTFDPKKEADAKNALETTGKAISDAVKKKDYDTALAKLDEVAKMRPDMADNLLPAKFQFQLMKKDYDSAYKTATLAGDTLKKQSQALNQMAWTIVDMPGVEKRDLPLAEKLATSAVAAAADSNKSECLDTLARIHYEQGSVDKAVEEQTQAVDKAAAEQKAELQVTLEKYKKTKADKPS